MPTIDFRLERAERLGIEKGIEKGAHQERLAVARKLLQRGVDDNTVRESVQLSVEELADIKRQLKN